MLVIKQLMVPIDFYTIYFPTTEDNGDQQLTNKIFFCVQYRKETYTGLEQCEGDFWVKYSFKK